jgi:chemotaxis protein MotB
MRRSRHEPSQEDDSNPLHDATWLYSYADLMTQLLIFAILIVSVLGVPDAVKPEAQPQAAASPLEQTVKNVERFVKESGLERDLALDRAADRLVIRMKSAILFAEGQAELTRGARAVLSGLAPLLTGARADLRVEGHTDDVPIRSGAFRSNWELSSARAISVVDYLEARGVDKARLSVAGYGEFHPIVANDGAEHRALNRRVEIVVLGG